MNRISQSPAHRVLTSPFLSRALALLILVAGVTAVSAHSQTDNSGGAVSGLHATHVLGLQDVRRNARGELSIVREDLRFQRDGNPAAQLTITSIQNISLGERDKQVGGVPMMLGKAAVPFAGGRVVSLFSHKKYDSVAIEYRDDRGGFHGGILLLAKGQGEALKKNLIAHGAHIGPSEESAPMHNTHEQAPEPREWSVEVDRVNAGATTLDTLFADAIYENLVRELTKSKQFKDVFRSGDRDANGAAGVLVLKTFVETYSPGSETRRAVTTVAGATEIKAHIQLVTRDGRVILERAVDGNVRFIGENLRATTKLASNTAKILKRSTLPATAALIPQPTSSKLSTARSSQRNPSETAVITAF